MYLIINPPRGRAFLVKSNWLNRLRYYPWIVDRGPLHYCETEIYNY